MRILSTGLVAAVTVLTATGMLASTSAAPLRDCDPTWRLADLPRQEGEFPPPSDIISDTARPPVLTSVEALSTADVRFTGSQSWWLASALKLTTEPTSLSWNGTTFETPAAEISAFPGPTPLLAGFEVYPSSLSFSSPSDGWSILQPYYDGAASLQNANYLQRWHDGRWTLVQGAVSPDPSVKGMRLHDVVSLSATDAWAVGMFYEAAPDVVVGLHPVGTLIEHWDGRKWSVIDSPDGSTDFSYFDAVTAISATDVWAVGRQVDIEGNVVALIAHYDGTEWTEVPAPAGSKPSALYGVGGTGSDDVWAVGAQTKPGTNLAIPLVMHWDGTAWSVVEVPDVGNSRSLAVFATSDDVWVVNEFPLSTQAMFLHYDGARWEPVRAPGTSGYNLRNSYFDVTGTGPDDVWAVGLHTQLHSKPIYEPLIAHLSCERRSS